MIDLLIFSELLSDMSLAFEKKLVKDIKCTCTGWGSLIWFKATVSPTGTVRPPR